MINLQAVSKAFDNNNVLNDLFLTIAPGEKITIIGPSGCGKSTILRLLLGLIRPDKGQIVIQGEDITTLSDVELRKAREKIGLLFQSSALFDSMTVAENVAFSLIEQKNPPSQSKIEKIVQEKLDMVDMIGFEDQSPANLSGGQKKRVGLARALASEPSIMLYDEPTTGLDPILSTNIENLIVKLSDQLKVTSIIVTHQISTIFRTADKIYFMHEGQLLPPESPESINNSSNKIIRQFIKGDL